MKKDLLYKLWDGTKIFVVNGNEVRDQYDEDFLEGGHMRAGYKFIPEDEIWISSDVVENDEDELLAHEIFEWYQMKYEDKNYQKAHGLSEKFEEALRMVDTASKEFKSNTKFSGITSIDELLKKVGTEHIDYDKRYLVQRVIKDYEDTWYVDLKSFDDEDEADNYMWDLWSKDPIDSYRIKDLKFE